MSIRDIARIAGVSASTVSKIINGKDTDISAETRQKVLRVIEEQNYVPYQKYLAKESMSSRLLGLVTGNDLPDREAVLKAAEQAAEAAGYSIVIRHAEQDAGYEHALRTLAQKNLAGALIISNEPRFEWQLEHRVAYVSLEGDPFARSAAVFYAETESAVTEAIHVLQEAGHRAIALIGTDADRVVADCFRTELSAAGNSYKEEWICLENDMEELERTKILQALGEEVTAVLCGNAEIACRVHRVMERAASAVPNRLSVISLREEPALAYINSGISSCAAPVAEMVADAITYLTGNVQRGQIPAAHQAYSARYVKRGSVAQAPVVRTSHSITVIGTLNMDITIRLPRAPITGETQIADSITSDCGGKGANQAVGAARLGGDVYMIGCLGNDLDSKKMYSTLTENHVHTEGVRFDAALPGGKAYINVDTFGESTIVVYPGANGQLDAAQLKRYRHLIEKSRYCLLSTELSRSILEYAAKLCGQCGTKVILKPAATGPLSSALLSGTEILVPNEKELFQIVPEAQTVSEGMHILHDAGVPVVIVTLGERGCCLYDGSGEQQFAGMNVNAADTTGGADAFIGALAVALCEEKPLSEAVRFAVAASGLAVTQYGALSAMPYRGSVEAFL